MCGLPGYTYDECLVLFRKSGVTGIVLYKNFLFIYIGRVYSIASYKISYFIATSIYDNFIY
jgi:hypothetical protein